MIEHYTNAIVQTFFKINFEILDAYNLKEGTHLGKFK